MLCMLFVGMDLPVVPLHKFPQYTMECCRLINSEWPRSETARLRSLECSGDTLPTCLILLKDNQVIGHCKLSVIPAIPDGCFIESVVIEKVLRGQGYGKYLMEKAEQYCQAFLNLRIIYLSTKGQELFYMKLGYNVCEPVSIYGSYIPRNQILNINISNNKEAIPKKLNSKVYMCKAL
ncbi:n-acetyltransferase 6 [Holotrichia oblita]|uniref:N-acetyltransferase 6 n=1 Tax=Holotrichia oblita TaxID=644536 RepID=A0ACB9TNP5_HOLOL|nr:n-acetyltransferase 6 [Holotrichia oblita]